MQKEKTGIWILNDTKTLMVNLINGEVRLDESIHEKENAEHAPNDLTKPE